MMQGGFDHNDDVGDFDEVGDVDPVVHGVSDDDDDDEDEAEEEDETKNNNKTGNCSLGNSFKGVFGKNRCFGFGGDH